MSKIYSSPENRKHIQTAKEECDFSPIIELYKPNVDEIHKLWRANHNALLKLLHNIDLPFFSVHGTHPKGADHIRTARNVNLAVASFRKKERTEKQLVRFYYMAMYTAAYGTRKGIGELFVIKTEVSGFNISVPENQLYESGGHFLYHKNDTDTEHELLERMKLTGEQLQHGLIMT
jgi:hypothetical protein